MFRAFEWTLAFRYLRLKGHEGFISVIAIFSLVGIFLGVAALIVTMSVMGGFREEILSKVIGFKGHLLYQPYAGRMTDYDAAASALSTVENVVRVDPVIEGQVMASFGDYATGAMVRGIRPEDLRHRPLVAENIVAGSLTDFGTGEHDIIIGKRLADTYGLEIGSLITLITPKGRVTAFGTVPRLASYEIKAIFEVGEYNYDSSYFFIPLDQAQKYFQYENSVQYLELTLTHPDLIEETYPFVQQRIRELGLQGRLIDWRVLNRSFFNALQIERNVMFIILTLIILVAVFNIISTMIMLVRSKNKDIAILRTMGASRASILRVFFIAGSLIGILGTFLGLAGGVVVADNLQNIVDFVETATGAELWNAEIRFISEIPAIIQPDEVIAVVTVSLTLTFLATLYPAWRAAKTDPVEALRYE
ncbi:lipoprotein-releasing ABC transporter permease subunit [Luteithermobacter gelatinilyticus]|uniref:lipoprotein-releasing ABC transporter permease subunit n=1 Tax=Luteithermobacter gelatinilyticus TaxID=2582913 RepID=UPI001107254A|nr:lipoprotein-releasing ABC transporter permease subunit [Luteithermobacter gelatinilyticus]|tara:strand:+ start:14451 stop:15707 length:1257 start_codon:yes stop_codon:yes gene_type:complete